MTISTVNVQINILIKVCGLQKCRLIATMLQMPLNLIFPERPFFPSKQHLSAAAAIYTPFIHKDDYQLKKAR